MPNIDSLVLSRRVFARIFWRVMIELVTGGYRVFFGGFSGKKFEFEFEFANRYPLDWAEKWPNF